MYMSEEEKGKEDCPVCGKSVWHSQMKNHLVVKARYEIYEWYKAKESIPTPHQTYIEHKAVPNNPPDKRE